jgi:hypothetical protein
MAKGRRKSNREAKKPKKSAAQKSKSAAISISIQAPGAQRLMPSPLVRRERRHG